MCNYKFGHLIQNTVKQAIITIIIVLFLLFFFISSVLQVLVGFDSWTHPEFCDDVD